MGDRRRDAEPAEPYTALAAGYDFVMSHVDYGSWAEYVQQLITRHHPETRSIVELGCGTASLALHLQPLGSYRYLATDGSEAMLSVARRKAAASPANIHIRKAEFAGLRIDQSFDAALLLYDGLNYLLEKTAIERLLRGTYETLVEGGIFIVDQSTPANSVNNEAYFENSERRDDFSYVRRSRFDPTSNLHRTTLEIRIGERTFFEEHVQRAYRVDEIRRLIRRADFEVEAAYDGFTFDEADEGSERVHWVLRRPRRP